MKRTVISLALALAMVFSLVLVAAPTAQAAAHTNHCVCGGKGAGAATDHICMPQSDWVALTTDASGNLLAGGQAVPVEAPAGGYGTGTGAEVYVLGPGNYYLDQDITLIYPISAGKKASDDTWTEACEVTICLNGKTLDNTTATSDNADEKNEDRAIVLTYANSTINIADCGTTGTIVGRSETTGAAIFQQLSSTVLNIYGGTIKSVVTTAQAGGVVRQNLGTLNMYGGTITDGKAGSTGGNLYIKGVMNMYGGTVTSGTAGTTGGNIHIANDGTVNLYGGTLGLGTCLTGQTGITVSKSTFNIFNTDASTVVRLTNSAGVIYTTQMDSSLTLDEVKPDTMLKLTKATSTGGSTGTGNPEPPTSNPTTGDSANLVVMGLGLVLGVAGMACLLPRKQKD